MLHIVQGFNIVSEAEVGFFPGILFLYDPTDVDNLISGFSAFSKSSLYVWKFSVHIRSKPSLKDFEHYLANELACVMYPQYVEFKLFILSQSTNRIQIISSQ